MPPEAAMDVTSVAMEYRWAFAAGVSTRRKRWKGAPIRGASHSFLPFSSEGERRLQEEKDVSLFSGPALKRRSDIILFPG